MPILSSLKSAFSSFKEFFSMPNMSFEVKANLAPGARLNELPAGSKASAIESRSDLSKLVMENTNPGKPIFTDWTAKKAVEDGYQVSGWVYACINAIVNAIQSVPWEVVQKVSNNEWDKVDDHPAANILEAPNPFTTRVQMFEAIVQHLCLAGNAFLFKVRDGVGNVTELWNISPDNIKPIPDENNYLLCYLYTSGSFKQLLRVEDVVHFRFTNPANRWWGMAPLQAIGKIVDTEVDAIEWWRWSLRNRAVKDGIIQFKHEVSSPQFNLVKEQILAQMTGPYNARFPLLIGSDSTYTPISMSPAEMDFMKGRNVCKKDIAGAYGIPLIILGDAENSSYNNSEQAEEAFWTDNICAKLNNLAGTLNLQLLPEFIKPSPTEPLFKNKTKFKIHFDLTDVPALQGHFKEKTAIACQYVQAGWPANAVNRRFKLGFDDIDGMDFGWLPGTYLPLINNPDAEELYNTETTLQAPVGGVVAATDASGKPIPAPTPKKPGKGKGGATSKPGQASSGPGVGRTAKKPIPKKPAPNRTGNNGKSDEERFFEELLILEKKMVKIAFKYHGPQGIADALSYSDLSVNSPLDLETKSEEQDSEGTEEDNTFIPEHLLPALRVLREALPYAESPEEIDMLYSTILRET